MHVLISYYIGSTHTVYCNVYLSLMVLIIFFTIKYRYIDNKYKAENVLEEVDDDDGC